ncbi:MAG: glycosyltransferase family 2 protein [Myxococcota bacterium]
MRPTVVVPHRRRRDLLERALRACEGWPVIVVDDTDDGLDLDVAKVRLGGGQGFARAANAGLAAARTPDAILLNDDAVPLFDCLDRLARAGGLCGPMLVGPDGVESAGMRMRLWRPVQVRRGRVDALSGACLHLPASARFDERFRHGCEDVELCLRLGGARLVAEARCWHEGGATVDRRTPEAQRHAVAGQLRLREPSWRDGVIVALNVAQVVRERGPIGRIGAIADGWRDARG